MSAAEVSAARRPGDACLRWDMRVALPDEELREVEERLHRDPRHPIGSGEPPDPDAWAAALGRGIFEILLGLRPLAQLRRWVVPALYDELARTTLTPTGREPTSGEDGGAHATQPCRVLSTRSCRIRDDAVEVSVVVSAAGRTRALALRLDRFRGRWLATALDIG